MAAGKGPVETLADRYMPRLMRPFWERLRESNIGYRLTHGAFWSTVGAGMSQALMLLTSIIAARILGREQFGQYGIVLTTVGMFGIFAGFGLGTTATKFVAECRLNDTARAGRIIALSNLVALGTGVAAAVILMLAAPILAARTLGAPGLSGLLQLAAGVVFFGAVNSSQVGALAGFQAFKVIARLNLLNGIMSFGFTVGGILLWGLSGALAGQVAAMAGACVFASYALKSEARHYGVPLDYFGCSVEKGLLLSFSFPAVMAGIVVAPINWVCSAILVNQPNGYAEMGLYSAANSWQKAILFLPGCVGAIALPMLSEFHSQNDRRQYKKALWYNILLNGSCAFTVFLFVMVFSKIIMKSYGNTFVDGYRILILLSSSAFLIAVGSVVGNALVSKGRMWTGFTLNLIWAVAYLLLAFYLVPHRGAIGLAMANLIAYVLHTMLQTTYAFAEQR